jgi:hypothetical protein
MHEIRILNISYSHISFADSRLFYLLEHFIVFLSEILDFEFTLIKWCCIIGNFGISHEIKLEILLVVDLEVLFNLELESAWLLHFCGSLVATGTSSKGSSLEGAWLLLGGCLEGRSELRHRCSLETGRVSYIGVLLWHVIFVDLRFVNGKGVDISSIVILVHFFICNFIRGVNTGGITSRHVRSTNLFGGLTHESSGLVLTSNSSGWVLTFNSSWNLVARVLVSSLVLLIELDFPIIV